MSQLILAIHTGMHDAAAAVFDDYELKAAVQLERLTRHKGDGRTHPDLCIDEVLSIAGATRGDVDVLAMSRGAIDTRYVRHMSGWRWLREQYRRRVEGRTRRFMMQELRRYQTTDMAALFDLSTFRQASGLREGAKLYFYQHHAAHALPALFYSDWDDALLVTADGGGDTVNYSHRHFSDGLLTTIYGDEDAALTEIPPDSLGMAYSAATRALGFRPLRHEGKLTGLAALGTPVHYEAIARRFSVDETGRVRSTFSGPRDMLRLMTKLSRESRREDLAASVQKVLEDRMRESIARLLARYPSKRLGVSGGVFANVKLNRCLAEQLDLEELFVFPPMGDEGLPIGGALAYLLDRDGIAGWRAAHRPLDSLYLGRDYTDAIDTTLAATPGIRRAVESPVDGATTRLAAGKIGAIYTGRMEFGPRALGARSILANPALRETHDVLNERLARSEFMPFAPVVRAERAAEVFDVNAVNARACRWMTIACDVRASWRARIPAVVHVDGSARPQTIRRDDNPLYYDIVAGFEKATALPVLVNTSFNVHEEPIVNTPAECVKALTDGRIDFVVTRQGVYERAR